MTALVAPPVAVVVLAAGGSRRLGRPKQLLEFRGATLLDATLATARSAGAETTWSPSAKRPRWTGLRR